MTLIALLERRPDGKLELRAPGVGLYREAPRAGELVFAGARLGRLEVLGTLEAITAPEGARGIVMPSGVQPARRPVGHGDVLLVVDPEGVAEAPSEGASSAASEGELVFRAPSSGRFYARPAPGRPPFVTPGDAVSAGQTVAILEVMKTFNRIQYGGAGLPQEARVTRVVPADGDDLGAGDVILELTLISDS